jgi:hypothetical protein
MLHNSAGADILTYCLYCNILQYVCNVSAVRRDKYEGKKLRCKLKLVATSQATSAQPTAAQRTTLSNGKSGGRWTVGGNGNADVAATWTAARNSSAQYKASGSAVLREEDKAREVKTMHSRFYLSVVYAKGLVLHQSV